METVADINERFNGFTGFMPVCRQELFTAQYLFRPSKFCSRKVDFGYSQQKLFQALLQSIEEWSCLTRSEKWNILSYSITSQIENSCLKIFFFAKVALPLHFTCTARLQFPSFSPHPLLKRKENKCNIRKIKTVIKLSKSTFYIKIFWKDNCMIFLLKIYVLDNPGSSVFHGKP